MMNSLCCLAKVMFHHKIVRGVWYYYKVSLVVGSRLLLGLYANDSIYLSRQPEQRCFDLIGGIPKG